MNKVENLGKRMAWLVLAAALGLSMAACSPQEETIPSQVENAQESTVSTVSEALESRETAPQGNSLSSNASLPESSSGQPEKGTSSLTVSSQSGDGETSEPQEQKGVAAEDFSSPEGDFTYLELEYGTPAQVVLPLFGLSGAEPDREWESYGGGFHSEYHAGNVKLEGYSFGLTLGFQDGLLNGFTFTCDAQEGEDLTSLYEDLRTRLEALYGLEEEETVLENVLVLGGKENGQSLYYDTQRFSTVHEEEGERSTRLYLSLMELDGSGVQVEFSLGLYQ